MPAKKLSPKVARTTVAAVAQAVSEGMYLNEPEVVHQASAIAHAARILGIDHQSVRRHLNRSEELYGLTVESVLRKRAPDEDDDLGDGLEVLDRHAAANTEYIEKSRKRWRRHIPVRLEPFGIAIFGDMHVDNKGTDLNRLKSDLFLCAAAGVRCINIGDTLDNFHWTGKLASKQASNRMSEKEGLEVARWVVRDSGCIFDAHILGNHDSWAGGPYSALFQEWARHAAHPTRFYDWIVGLTYAWEGGEYNLLAAHDFKGHSIHNPLHGLFRRAKDDGTFDGYVAGHRHNAADGSFENAFRGKRYDYCRVGSYKKWDDYGHVKGFDQQSEGESAMFVINPLADELSGRCRVLPSISEGLEFLEMKRRNYA